LKTTPVSLLCYAHRKSKNILTQRQKDAAEDGGEPYDKEDDVYRNMYEQLGMTYEMETELVSKVDEVKAGEGPDAWEREEGEGGFSADGESLALALGRSVSTLTLTTFFSTPLPLTLAVPLQKPTRPSSSLLKPSTPLPASGLPAGSATSTSSPTARVRVIGIAGRLRGIGMSRRESG
jgi:hypothetical protein